MKSKKLQKYQNSGIVEQANSTLQDSIFNNQEVIGSLLRSTSMLKKHKDVDLNNAYRDYMQNNMSLDKIAKKTDPWSKKLMSLYESGKYKEAINHAGAAPEDVQFWVDEYLAVSDMANDLGVKNIKPKKSNRLARIIGNRAMYDPTSDTIYADDIYEVEAELSHALQKKNGVNIPKKMISDWIEDPYISKEGYRRNYERKGSLENQAHEEYGPLIYQDKLDRISNFDFFRLNNKEQGGAIMKTQKKKGLQKYQDSGYAKNPYNDPFASIFSNAIGAGFNVFSNNNPFLNTQDSILGQPLATSVQNQGAFLGSLPMFQQLNKPLGSWDQESKGIEKGLYDEDIKKYGAKDIAGAAQAWAKETGQNFSGNPGGMLQAYTKSVQDRAGQNYDSTVAAQKQWGEFGKPLAANMFALDELNKLTEKSYNQGLKLDAQDLTKGTKGQEFRGFFAKDGMRVGARSIDELHRSMGADVGLPMQRMQSGGATNNLLSSIGVSQVQQDNSTTDRLTNLNPTDKLDYFKVLAGYVKQNGIEALKSHPVEFDFFTRTAEEVKEASTQPTQTTDPTKKDPPVEGGVYVEAEIKDKRQQEGKEETTTPKKTKRPDFSSKVGVTNAAQSFDAMLEYLAASSQDTQMSKDDYYDVLMQVEEDKRRQNPDSNIYTSVRRPYSPSTSGQSELIRSLGRGSVDTFQGGGGPKRTVFTSGSAKVGKPESSYKPNDIVGIEEELEYLQKGNIDDILYKNKSNAKDGHKGIADAVRHSATSAQVVQNLIDRGLDPAAAVVMANAMGLGHEISSPNTISEHASDIWNNFMGSLAGLDRGSKKAASRIQSLINNDALSYNKNQGLLDRINWATEDQINLINEGFKKGENGNVKFLQGILDKKQQGGSVKKFQNSGGVSASPPIDHIDNMFPELEYYFGQPYSLNNKILNNARYIVDEDNRVHIPDLVRTPLKHMQSTYGSPVLEDVSKNDLFKNKRAYYRDSDNTAHIRPGDVNDYLAELSHAYQNKEKKQYNKDEQLADKEFATGKHKTWRDAYDAIMYSTPGTREYEAHSEIQPKLEKELLSYIDRGLWANHTTPQIKNIQTTPSVSDFEDNLKDLANSDILLNALNRIKTSFNSGSKAEKIKSLDELKSMGIIDKISKVAWDQILDNEKGFPDDVNDAINRYIGYNTPKKVNGGQINQLQQMMGYKDNSPYRSLPFQTINSNSITMDGVSQSLLAIADNGEVKMLPPNSGLHKFKGAKSVTEIPLGSFEEGMNKKKNGGKITSPINLSKNINPFRLSPINSFGLGGFIRDGVPSRPKSEVGFSRQPISGASKRGPMGPKATDIPSYNGGVRKLMDMPENEYIATENLIPIQTEKGEMIVLPTGDLSKVMATKRHHQMDEDEVTDVAPEGAYILSSFGKVRINRDEAEQIITETGVKPYRIGGSQDSPTEKNLASMMTKKSMAPADIAKRVDRFFPVNSTSNPFELAANNENKTHRVPYLEGLIQLSELDKLRKGIDSGMESQQQENEDEMAQEFKNGGSTWGGVPMRNMLIPKFQSSGGVPPTDPYSAAIQAGTGILELGANLWNSYQQRKAQTEFVKRGTFLSDQAYGKARNEMGMGYLAGMLGVMNQDPTVTAKYNDPTYLRQMQTRTPMSTIEAISNRSYANMPNYMQNAPTWQAGLGAQQAAYAAALKGANDARLSIGEQDRNAQNDWLKLMQTNLELNNNNRIEAVNATRLNRNQQVGAVGNQTQGYMDSLANATLGQLSNQLSLEGVRANANVNFSNNIANSLKGGINTIGTAGLSYLDSRNKTTTSNPNAGYGSGVGPGYGGTTPSIPGYTCVGGSQYAINLDGSLVPTGRGC